MQRGRVSLFLGALLLIGAYDARASGEASLYYGRAYAGEIFSLDMNTFGGSVGAFTGPIGFELGLEYSPVMGFEIGPIGFGASILNVMGNVVVQAPVGRFTPYGTIGYGAFVTRAGIDPLPIGLSGTSGAWNFGFGAKFFLSEHVGLRADYRRFVVAGGGENTGVDLPLTDLQLNTTPDLNRFVGGVAFRF